MSMATNGSGAPPNVKEPEKNKETIIEEERRQMAAVRQELAEVFKIYEKKAKARLGNLTREAHKAYEDLQETDQSEGAPENIRELMEKKVNEMKQLKEKVELCLQEIFKETGESKDSTSKADKTSESPEREQMDKELEKILETDAEVDKGEDFDRLPETLRKCLLCLSIFPVGREISKRVLIYWWIGEGFVTQRKDETAEQVGEVFFKHFLDHEFIHPVYNKRSGNIVKCRIHPWIHWMLISKARERNFFNFDETGTPISSPSKLHHDCLITKLNDGQQERKPYKPDERLVLLFNVNVKYLDLDLESFSKMKNIVVLQLGRWHASAHDHHIEMEPQVLDKLSSLSNLKYLSLRGISLIETIPKSISKLQYLQVLDLRGCQNLRKLEDGVTKLKRLTHLDVSECYMLESMPKGLGLLSELSVIKGFVISRSHRKAGKIADLQNLHMLKKLSIIIGSQVKKSTDLGELVKLKGLSSLTVIWSDLPVTTPGYVEHDVNSLKLPPNLEKLDLRFYPTDHAPKWLDPDSKDPPAEKLKKLYIRGGKLETLALTHSAEGTHPKWNIETLRLKFLKKLKLNWPKIELPSLNYLEHYECGIMDTPPLMDADGVWTRVKETDSNAPPITGTSDSTISAPSAIIPDAAATATTATSPSSPGPSSSPTLATTTTTTTTDATTSQTHQDTTTTAPIATSTPTTTTSDSTISAPSAIIPDAAATATTATSPSPPGPSSSPTLATTTTTTTATSPLATPTTGPALTPPTRPTTTTSVSPPTPKVVPTTPDPDDDNEHDEPAHDPSSSASTEAHLIDAQTTSPDGISASGVDSLVDEPTSGTPHAPTHIVPAPTTASGPSSSTPTIVPPNKVDHEDDLEDKSEHDITSSASTAAHAIDPNTASPDDATVSAIGAASMAAEPTSGTPSVPGPTNAADVTRDSSLSSNPSSSATTANQPSISTTPPQVN